MKKSVLIFLALLSSITVFGQHWQEMILMGERDYFKIRDAFYAEWDGRMYEKGSGYNHFKRWEQRMLPRLVEGRYLPNIGAAYNLREGDFLKARLARTNNTDGWQSLGPTSWVNAPNGYNPGIGRINCITGHPTDPNTLFIGAPAGGLWKTTNGGDSWTVLSDDLPVLGVTDFYVDAANPNLMYLLSGDAYGSDTYSIGIFKSTNGGVTWSNTSNFNPDVSSGYRMFKMLVDPTNNQRILTGGNGGILLSENGGNSWTSVLNEVVVDLEFKPGDPDVVYASTWGNNFFYKSEDGGLTWDEISTGFGGLGRTALGVSADNPEYVYILAATSNSRFGGVYRSEDSGETFQMQSNAPNIFGYSATAEDDRGQGNYDLAIAVNPEDAEDIYVSGIHIWNSKDGGANWDVEGQYGILNFWVYDPNNVQRYVHADNHTLDFIHGNLYAGSDGGIWKTTDLGQTWSDLSFGLGITQFYRLGLDPNNPNVIIAGAQDNGSNIYNNGTWYHIFGADGMEALVDHTAGTTVYSSYQFGGIIRYGLRGGNIEAYVNDPEQIDESGGWITPFSLHPQNNNILFAGFQNLWKSEDKGDTWTRISDFGSTSTLRSLAISKSNPNYIYTSSGESIYRTKDGGTTWEPINAGLPTEYMTYIAVSEVDPEKIWATFSGYTNGQKAYYSSNAGTNWTNISQGLPNIPANCIVHVRANEDMEEYDQLLVGTDVGVYKRDANASQWELWSDELPSVIVNELEVNYGSREVVAATFGRGIWKRSIGELLPLSAREQALAVVYPNPTNDHFVVRTDQPNTLVQLFDSNGKLIKQRTITQAGEMTENLDLSPAGIYFVKVRAGEKEKVFKLVKN